MTLVTLRQAITVMAESGSCHTVYSFRASQEVQGRGDRTYVITDVFKPDVRNMERWEPCQATVTVNEAIIASTQALGGNS